MLSRGPLTGPECAIAVCPRSFVTSAFQCREQLNPARVNSLPRILALSGSAKAAKSTSKNPARQKPVRQAKKRTAKALKDYLDLNVTHVILSDNM